MASEAAIMAKLGAMRRPLATVMPPLSDTVTAHIS